MQGQVNLDRKGIKNLAQKLAKKYATKDVLIGLVGPLGAGKTAFVKDFAKALGVKNAKSPTFVIAHAHKLKSKTLHHFDFYRLEHKKQLQPLGINEIILNPHRIIFIEWVDKFPEIAKKCDLILTFKITGKNLRHVSIQTSNDQ